MMDTSEHGDKNSAHIPEELVRQKTYACHRLENFLGRAATD
jgi:hypothetical protein